MECPWLFVPAQWIVPPFDRNQSLTTRRLKHDLWNPIANELGIPWRACEAMHWAMGEHEMARRANAVPFAIAAAHAEPGEYGGGRVAQRDRMLESTRVFEGRDLTTLTSHMTSPNGNGNISTPATPSALTYPAVTMAPIISIRPIKREQSFSAYEDEDDYDNDDEELEPNDEAGCAEEDENAKGEEGSDRLRVRVRARRRRGRSRRRFGAGVGTGTGTAPEIRLPGIAQLDGEIAAFAERGGEVVIKQEERSN